MKTPYKAFIVLLSIPALSACSGQATPPPATSAIVRSVTVALTDYSSEIALTGEIRAQQELTLSFRTSGRIQQRLVDTGDHVEAGQLLAQLDPAELQAEVDAASAAVTSAQVQADQAAATLARQDTLLKQGVTTKAQYEQALEASQSAQGALTAAQSALATARNNLSFSDLKSAVAGIITSRTADTGEVAVTGEPIFTVAADGNRDAVFNVPESVVLAAPDTTNAKLYVTDQPSITATGKLRQVAPALSSTTGTIEVKLGLDNPPKEMSLGTAVTGTLTTAPKPSIVLPSSALVSDGPDPAVWVIDPTSGQVALKKITVGSYGTETMVVSAGIQVGQQVVTTGAKLLHPGELVKAENPA